MREKVVKHTIKDSVFTDLFKDTKYLLQFYNALHPEDIGITENDIDNVTISNVLTYSLKAGISPALYFYT